MRKLLSCLVSCICVLLVGCATDIKNTNQESVFSVGSSSSYTLNEKLTKANLAYEEGRLVEAEKWFLNILSEHNALADAWFKLGNIYYRSGRYAAAVHAYESVLKADNKYERAWYNLALTRVSQSVEVLDQGFGYIDKNSPYFAKTVNLKSSLVNRVGGNSRKGLEKGKSIDVPLKSIDEVMPDQVERQNVGSQVIEKE